MAYLASSSAAKLGQVLAGPLNLGKTNPGTPAGLKATVDRRAINHEVDHRNIFSK
jgi:hypothetical protein